ncbi:adenylate/guanylate cyclase domain-containing protein [Bradyrhizobium jicamae]|uniref:adenylate/guanylate cyclase domain-containing protein n=1 Tax=Bradyrhizobium jicamae TaxID=280332 RepID=UPI0028A0C58E|nr:adenylate/guanylate cyclase domain-containing protein [Bradyrhizobium jicamae]
MAEERVERRLAAILAADVVGYSRLMGADEVSTLAALKALRREIIDPAIAAHNGRIVKTTGDGMLVEFASAVDAVTCGVAIQEKMAERTAEPAQLRIQFRVGINIGDIIIDGGDIFGDGVNIAARIENECEPGCVCLSDDAYRQVRGKMTFAFDDLGERSLKNIDRPLRIYVVRSVARSAKAPAALIPEVGRSLPLPDKPSIAVLPFSNLSGDPEQDYFADGMVEDIITTLARFKELFVIARNSSFVYKGRSVDVKQVGRELGVRYVLEGSIRKAGNRVRITGQLVDSTIGAHLWADRFDGGLDDIFDLQDRVAAKVVGAIAPAVEKAEIERAKRKPTANLDAYDYYLRGVANIYLWTKESTAEALALFEKATELDSKFASAYGMAALCYAWRKMNGWMDDQQENDETARLALQAVELGRDDAIALGMGGFALALVVGEVEDGAALVDRALVLNPNMAAGWLFSGWIRTYLGEPDLTVEHSTRAIRLSPLDPFSFMASTLVATGHFFAGRYDEASSWAEKGLREQANWAGAARVAAASHALAGRLDQAKRAMSRHRQIFPGLRVGEIKQMFPFRRAEDLARYQEGLRKAGLPE